MPITLRKLVFWAFELFVLLFVGALLVGQILGTPVLLGYVETGSMAPTLEPGDGFVAIPAAIAGSPNRGDVVTFQAEELDGGRLTTHRVVGMTDRGYITKGDANPMRDQAGAEPPVKDPQIVAHALQINSHLVTIPNLGTVVISTQNFFTTIQNRVATLAGVRHLRGTQGLSYLVLAFSAIIYAIDLFVARRNRSRARSHSRNEGIDDRIALAIISLLVVSAATGAMAAPSGSQSFDILSAEFESEDPSIIPHGESSIVKYEVPNSGFVPVYAFLEPGSDAVTLGANQFNLKMRSHQEVSVTLHAPPETGHYRRFVVEHRYLAVLPAGVIESLYETHPWLPIIAIDALLGGGFYALGRLLIGEGRIRDRRREAGPPSWLPAPIAGLFGRSR